jgi:Transglycosylase-like domain
MRSLAAQLVALALAVPVSTVSSSQHDGTTVISRTTTLKQPQRAGCNAYCQARVLRHALRRVHGRTVALAHRAALPVPPPPRLGWRRTSLRVQLAHQARVLGRYRVQARRPLRLRLERFEAWVCIHRHEAAWNDSGDPYWGGLQMDRGFMRAYGGDMIRRHRGGLADTWTPAEQIVVAERAYASRGFAPWPHTSRSCGVR